MRILSIIATSLVSISLFACSGAGTQIDTTTIGDAADSTGNVTDPNSVFTSDTPEIFVSASLSNPSADTDLRGEWWYLTGNEIRIATSPLEMTSDQGLAAFSLSRPTAGWPIGDYEMRIFVDNRRSPNVSIPFSVE